MFSTGLEMSLEVLFRKMSCSKAVTSLTRLIVELSSGDSFCAEPVHLRFVGGKRDIGMDIFSSTLVVPYQYVKNILHKGHTNFPKIVGINSKFYTLEG